MLKPVSLIIGFCNDFDALSLLFAGLDRQTFKGFEVIIADDGSREQVVEQVGALIGRSHLACKHVWHEDKGFRKNTILNRAVLASSGDYLVFIDGDCIPHRAFMEEHARHGKPRRVLAGRRVELSERISAMLTPDRVRAGHLENRLFPLMVWDSMLGRASFVENALHIPLGFLCRAINRGQGSIIGSNYSLHKADLLAVNGFDERYHGPGLEDSDVEYRLRLNGVHVNRMRHMAIQYHVYHAPRGYSAANSKILADTMKKRIAFTPHGIERASVAAGENRQPNRDDWGRGPV